MATVVVTIKIMPESPDSDLKKIEEEAIVKIKEYGGDVGKVEIEPVAFGLKAVKLIFIVDESKGGTEDLENEISGLDQVNSVETIDVRRAIG
ncbi:MAG TPA: elongation factor 1-beta [Candidatus Nanoarchaeia archaeon]|nr:elongation factor 1-beta [Candidatus Nanoarchaeia archaeon]